MVRHAARGCWSGGAAVPLLADGAEGRTGKQLGEPNRKKIADAMTVDNLSPGNIPAGFTYLGQFLDHDLTFDKSGLMEGVDISPATLLQSRSPSLDLDSLYGNGPQDPGSAKFYEADGLHLKMGAAQGGPAGSDLPREPTGEAIIPDPRNDENLAVAQTHAAFIRFHNRVVDTLPATVPAAQKFSEARKIVTKHYQWMVRTDYLPRICASTVVTNVFNQGRKAFEVGATPTSIPTMPIEFSVAAFRLGHSMVRAEYSWNRVFEPGHASSAIPVLTPERRSRRADPEHLDRRLPPALQLRPTLPRPAGARRPTRKVQPRDANRHEAGQPAADTAQLDGPRPRPEEQPRLPQLARARTWSNWRPGSRWPRSSRTRA